METRNYASFYIRLFASLLDMFVWSLLFLLPLFFISFYFSDDIKTHFPAVAWFALYLLVVSALKTFINAWLISKMGGGVGKLLFGLRIEHQDGAKLTLKRALFREIVGKMASGSLFGIGYYWIFKNSERQAWHDMIADTYVIKRSNAMGGALLLLLLLVIELVLFVLIVTNFAKSENLINQMKGIFEEFDKKSTPANDIPGGPFVPLREPPVYRETSPSSDYY